MKADEIKIVAPVPKETAEILRREAQGNGRVLGREAARILIRAAECAERRRAAK